MYGGEKGVKMLKYKYVLIFLPEWWLKKIIIKTAVLDDMI